MITHVRGLKIVRELTTRPWTVVEGQTNTDVKMMKKEMGEMRREQALYTMNNSKTAGRAQYDLRRDRDPRHL